MHQQRRIIHQKCFLNGPQGAPGERSWNLPRGTGEKPPILTGFWNPFGSPGVSLGAPGGTHFRLWTLKGRSQGAQGANFKPSWASPLFDADSGPKKSPKKLNFEGARTSKIAFSPRRECNFHFFTSFAPEPKNRRFWELFWEPFGSLLAPIWPPGRLLGLPGAPQGRFFGQRVFDRFCDALLTPFKQL